MRLNATASVSGVVETETCAVLQMYVLPVPTEIKPVQNQMTADVGHDLRKHTYDFSRADNVLKALGVSNNLKMRDRKPKKKAADAQVICPTLWAADRKLRNLSTTAYAAYLGRSGAH